MLPSLPKRKVSPPTQKVQVSEVRKNEQVYKRTV